MLHDLAPAALPESPEVRGSECLWLSQKVLRSGGSEPSALSHHLCSPSYLVPDTFENQLAGLYGRKSTARWCFDWHFGVSAKDLGGGIGVLIVLQPQIWDHSIRLFSACYTEYTVYWPISDGLLPESTSKCDFGMLNTDNSWVLVAS